MSPTTPRTLRTPCPRRATLRQAARAGRACAPSTYGPLASLPSSVPSTRRCPKNTQSTRARRRSPPAPPTRCSPNVPSAEARCAPSTPTTAVAAADGATPAATDVVCGWPRQRDGLRPRHSRESEALTVPAACAAARQGRSGSCTPVHNDSSVLDRHGVAADHTAYSGRCHLPTNVRTVQGPASKRFGSVEA